MKSVKMEYLENNVSQYPPDEDLITPAVFYQEDLMTSRYVDAHRSFSNINSELPLHSHNFYEILGCRNMVDAEYLVGAERYRIQKGDIIFITPGTSHRPLLPERMQSPYHRDMLWISPEFIDNLNLFGIPIQELIPEKSFLLRTAGTRWAYLMDLFQWSIAESEKKEPGWELVVLSNTSQLLVHIARALLDQTAEPLLAEKPQLLDQVLDYIESHLSEKITLTDVAQQFFVSQSTITQTFRNKMGVSFYRCVTQRRLIAAKRMIEQGLPMEHISDIIGFKDYSSFYRAFKQEYGISPRQYRVLQGKQGK